MPVDCYIDFIPVSSYHRPFHSRKRPKEYVFCVKSTMSGHYCSHVTKQWNRHFRKKGEYRAFFACELPFVHFGRFLQTRSFHVGIGIPLILLCLY